jgi:hypothetical protein
MVFTLEHDIFIGMAYFRTGINDVNNGSILQGMFPEEAVTLSAFTPDKFDSYLKHKHRNLFTRHLFKGLVILASKNPLILFLFLHAYHMAAV